MKVAEEGLNKFIKKAMSNCYLGEFKKSDTIERKGFFEMEFSDGELDYRDSFVGFYISTGQEIVRENGIPIWGRSYRGGVISELIEDKSAFYEIEQFLRENLELGNKEKDFYPRGLQYFARDDFEYKCIWKGHIYKFSGRELIYKNGQEIFYHEFFGGEIIGFN